MNKSSSSNSFKGEIIADQIRWLFNQSQISIGYNLVVAALLCYILLPYKNHFLLDIWYGYLTLSLIVRVVIIHLYRKKQPSIEKSVFWGWLYGGSIFLTGLAWGSAGLWLYADNAILPQAFLAFILAGMATGAAAVFSAVLPIGLIYLAIVLLPFTARLIINYDSTHLIMALLVFLFTLSMTQVIYAINRTIRNAINLKFQNQDLIKQLSWETEQIIDLNLKLQIRNQAIEASTDGIFIIRAEHPHYPIIYANKAFETITDHTLNNIEKNSCFFLEDANDPINFIPIRAALYENKSGHTLLHRRNKRGEPSWIELHVTPVTELSGKPGYFVGSLWDVSAHKNLEDYLAYQATHDQLTQLPNRLLIFDRLQQAILTANRLKNSFALIFCDVDHFKMINDTYGHSIGDQILTTFAQRLKNCIRSNDTVARLGGDEFLILIASIHERKDLVVIAEKILKAINVPFEINQQSFTVTASIGIAIYPQDSTDAGNLLVNADLALYRCKEIGRNNFMFYSPK